MLRPDDGFFFGLGAFETIAVEQGNPLFLQEHLQRLKQSLCYLGISINDDELREKIKNTLKLQEMQQGSQVLKITATEQNLLLTTRENQYTKQQHEKGFITAYAKTIRNETSPLTYHKTLNYGDCILEKRLATKQGIDEPVFLNTKGEIAEGATTNVFFVKDGKLYTPQKTCGLLPGIVRQYLLWRYEVTETSITPAQVVDFDEMFLTNSLLGIMPVIALGAHTFASTDFAKNLYGEYLEVIQRAG